MKHDFRAYVKIVLALAGLLFSMTGCRKKDASPQPLPPQEALKRFHFSEDFKAELFLSEPQVVSPVEMAFDENGRIYVAEMLDYPEDPPPGVPARSRIKLLEDTDGDGKIDRVTIFADHVLEVSGLLPWKGGLLVTSAPDILYMEDTDGDGVADVRKVLYTGFPKVNPESRVTNLRLGIDNWVYAANNGHDGKIISPDHPDRPAILVRGADFRFRPDRGLAEAASGPTQFGMTFDDWGNRFITHNTVHLRHVVVPMHYLLNAPLLEIGAVSQDISDHGRGSARMFPITAPQAWRVERTRLRQHRFDKQHVHRTEFASGYFTAASGSTAYNGDVFPKEYVGSIFTGDVSGNLVHRDILTADGVTFSARRAKEGIEFLASTDTWFRPCNFANAPDGNLYMIDIYRLFIETPESIPEELKKKMNFWAGDTMGRIYRIVPNKPLRKRNLIVRLGAASTAELVNQLENTNGWHRQTAQRLLVDRQDHAAVPLLINLVQNSAYPQARVHALWTLEGLSALDPPLVLRALKDSDPHVREHALRLSEAFLSKSKPMQDAVLALTQDPEPRVQFQLALTLGQLRNRRALEALGDIASQRAADHWFRIAVLSSVGDSASEFFQLLQSKGKGVDNAEFLSQLAALIGAKHDATEISRFLTTLLQRKDPGPAPPGLAGLARGLKLAGVKNLRVPGAEAALEKFFNTPNEQVQSAAREAAQHFELQALIEKALLEAASPNLPISKRELSIRALRGARYEAVAPVLRKLLEVPEAPELQTAVVETLASFDDETIPATLVASWRSYSPAVRNKVLAALLSRQDWMKILMKALEEGQIERAAIDVAAQARLLEHPDQAVVQRARNFFQKEMGDRMKVVAHYRDVLKLAGDVTKGKTIFEKNCARCHMPQQHRGRVGPDLSGINNKTKEELLTSILNPSYAIEPGYVNYIVTTKDRRMYDGILANETPGAIRLRNGSEDGDITILRANIAEIRASSISLMPDEFEKSMSRQDLADVIAYLRGGL